MCGCFSCGPHWGPGPQPGMCPDCESNWSVLNPLSHTSQGLFWYFFPSFVLFAFLFRVLLLTYLAVFCQVC